MCNIVMNTEGSIFVPAGLIADPSTSAIGTAQGDFFLHLRQLAIFVAKDEPGSNKTGWTAQQGVGSLRHTHAVQFW